MASFVHESVCVGVNFNVKLPKAYLMSNVDSKLFSDWKDSPRVGKHTIQEDRKDRC